jgi:hypothetical protein
MTENLLAYARIRKEFGEHGVRKAEVPVEYTVSLPLPTTRRAVPGYAGFACPALRVPRQPLRLREPDRWWLLGAAHGELLAYGRTSVLPFAEMPAGPLASTGAEFVTLPSSTRPVAAVLEDLRVLDETMARAIGPFFDGLPGDAVLRADLTEILRVQAGAPEVLHWYRAVAPDFFRWLVQ